MSLPAFTSQQILAARGSRNAVDPFRPYAMLLEEECGPSRTIDQVATIFLTNRECPFHCLMCDLWQNTTEDSVPVGAIPAQIAFALEHLTSLPFSPASGEKVAAGRMRGLSSGGDSELTDVAAKTPHPNPLPSEGRGDKDARSLPSEGTGDKDARSLRSEGTGDNDVHVRHIKLYNSGNFFDAKAIAPEDHEAIAKLVSGFESVVVENHPRLCDHRCGEFQRRIGTQLEIAMGLETIHPEILPSLNKQMTTEDFARACGRLLADGIRLRAFVLLRSPGMSRSEGVEWALRSVEFAFDCGVDCCAIIPTRAGNGIMEQLASDGHFAPPALSDLEAVLAAGIRMHRGRVFVDLWDALQFAECAACCDSRIERLRAMNLQQQVLPPIECDRCQ